MRISSYYRLIKVSRLTLGKSEKRETMAFLIVSIIVAIATATSVYIASASLVLAFFAYSAAGTLTLFSALIATGLFYGDTDD